MGHSSSLTHLCSWEPCTLCPQGSSRARGVPSAQWDRPGGWGSLTLASLHLHPEGLLHTTLCRWGLSSDCSWPEDQAGLSTGLPRPSRLTLGPWSPWDPAAWASFPLGKQAAAAKSRSTETQGPGICAATLWGGYSGVGRKCLLLKKVRAVGTGPGTGQDHGPSRHPLLLPVMTAAAWGSALLPAGQGLPPPWKTPRFCRRFPQRG